MHVFNKLFSTLFATALLLLMSSHASAQNMRLRALPDPIQRLQEFGYTASIANQMKTGSRDDLWARVPSAGWTNETYNLRNKMFTALGGSGFDDAMANVIINHRSPAKRSQP